jgi:amino acid permease
MADILVYVGHVCTRFVTLCVLWTCIDGFDVWIHVEIESDAEMLFICYIVDIYVVLWIYMLYMWFKGKKTAKEKEKNISQLCQQHGTKLLAKLGFLPSKTCQLCQQGSFANNFV